ncbi:TetR family transcriptional regulator [Qipengyuania qiaonensis]|uniref:TetR family transcriptional regulator n=1 Tax=Qipengyuania qiaonensis TaxID=2867240 RepID=A0ABS7J2U7_9SPHN|nr:TetR family transcriptional regulator [Qipengyuania qiaonensis]MBX7481660.1 TetR family transcriptional regulator [Qipengyuania qiaonensis]
MSGQMRRLAALEGRWTLRLLACLARGPCQFSVLRSDLGAISAKTLTLRLRELEALGIVHYERRQYRLDGDARSLEQILAALSDWAGRAISDRSGPDDPYTQDLSANRPARGRSARSRKAILAAARLELADRGPRALSIEAVAARARIAKGTLYRHFRSAEELYRVLLNEQTDDEEEAGCRS